MDGTVILATSLSFVAALISGLFALKTARLKENLRQEHAATARLREATGAMRLQMFLATRSVVRRLDLYYDGQEDHPYELRAYDPGCYEHHHAGLLIYGLLRPLALSHIIEHATYYGDLLIEPTMADLLRFNHAAYEMLTGYEIGRTLESVEAERQPQLALLGRGPRTASTRKGEWQFFTGFNPDLCWDQDTRTPPVGKGAFQRVRSTYLRRAAAALVADDKKRCLTHAEFCELWEQPKPLRDKRAKAFHEALDPVTSIIHEFHPAENPVFWLRLVGYAYVCAWFHTRVRQAPLAGGETWFGHWLRRLRPTSDAITYMPLVLPTAEMLEAVEKTKEVKTVPENGGLPISTTYYQPSVLPGPHMPDAGELVKTVAGDVRPATATTSIRPSTEILKTPGNVDRLRMIMEDDAPWVREARDYVRAHADRYEERFKEIIQRAL